MELKTSLIFGFISLQILKPSSSHLHSGSLGDIEFSCPAGQYFNGGNCYAAVSVPMTWSDAKRTCKRQGQHLFWVLDVDELKAVDHLARSTWEYYWSGLSQTESWLTANEALWSHSNETVSLEEVVWEDDQPDTRNGKCVFSKKNGYGAFGNCLRKLPFVCKSEAVLKDYFRCRSGEGIQSKFVCDGHNDCQDMSDEADCASRCHHVINAEYGPADTKPSGVIVNTNIYLDHRSCFWSIVTNVGSTIKVQVNTFNTEKNADVVEFRTGGREGEIFLAELTGKLAVNNQPVYYSSDNVFNIRLVTDNTVIQSGGFRISWTTDVPEVFNDVKMLTATTSVQDLKSPFYDAGNFPQEKVFEWKITASTLNVITLEFENLDIGKDSKLYLWDQDDISLTPTLDGVSAFKPKHYISKSKSIRLMLITGREEAPFPKGLYIKYWEGCSISYMSKEGTIQSPGYIVDSYPENVVCTWTIQRPTSETRTMALRFNMFDLQDEQDYLKIYNDTNEMLHTGDGFTGTTDLTNNFEVRSTNGYIKLVFTTNYVLTDKGFEAEFSLDCAELAVSEETRYISSSGYETSFMNTIEMSCDDGYSFVNEGRSNVHFIKCEKGGEWNETRIPNCMITYCPIPPAIDNGYIVESSGVKVDNNVTYKCNDGFTMNGEPVIKCLQDGNWEDAPRCTAATCPDLTTPGNGGIETLVGDGRDFASVVQYFCDPGYETYGNVTTYCQTGGKWSHDPPTCEKISCPMPRFQRGNLNPNDTLKFNDDTTLTCDSGFGINGTDEQTQVLKCESDGRLSPYVACLDVDECNGTIVSVSPCPDTEDCHNTIGSHVCTCKDGYVRIGNAACSNINECSSNNGIGPCHQRCTDLTPGYTCGCNDGFVLYTAEGISNISLADGEDGEKEGDVYHINHTCVRKQCAVPPPLTNGKVLSKKELFFFEDSVEFTCDHGYKLSSTNGKLDCQSDGSWSSNIPSCQMATCLTPTTGSIARSTNIYPSGSTVDYNKEVNIECQYGSIKINRTLYCSYNVMSGVYELLGDAPECPEIDCGPPEEVPGSKYSGLTNTNLDSTFTFDCNSGFERSGMLMDGTYTVRCQDNGRWNIGNLTCTGGRCKDPGTPGGAMQVVTSYEVGQMVYFKCNNSGYFPEPPQPLECVVDTITGNITWNATVEDGSADLPECLDKTPPVFSNCPSDLIYVDKTEEYTYPMLTATDNSGAVKNINNPGGYRPSGLRTNSDIDITYTAGDFSGNTADCVIKIRVKDYARHELKCPLYIMEHIDTADGIVFNVSDVVSVSPSDSELTFKFSPAELITLDHKAMVEQKKAVVTATDKWGAEDQCSFFVETKADACFKESFPVSVPNAAPVTCTSSNISCTVTCNSGYVFFDGNTTKTYDCTGQNMWMPALPPDTCIKYDEPSYIIELQVVYKSNPGFAKDCKAGHDEKIRTNNASLTNDIDTICNNNLVSAGPLVITHTETTTTGFDFRTRFVIKLLSDDVSKLKDKLTCKSLLELQVSSDGFLDYTGSVQCNSGLTSTTNVVRQTTDSANQVMSSGNQCDNGIKKMISDSTSKCIPCPPGTYSGIGDECNICPDGKFQSNFGQDECLDCPAGNPVPSEDKTTCLAVCPAGFISVDGLPTCMPCPEDRYWVNKTYCEACPNSGNTLGKDAIPDVNGCKEPCDEGEYSVTGYAPCKKCPVNFYQDQTAQDKCTPCGSNSITERSGSNHSSLCIQLGVAQCPGNSCSPEERAITCENRCDDAYNNTLPCQCNSGCVAANNCCDDYQWKCVDLCTDNDCSGQGSCSYKNHRRFCTCYLGYKGDNCEMELDPCDSSPCWNDGVCTKINSTNFNCSCTVDTSCEMIREEKKAGQDSDWGEAPRQLSLEACEQYCLGNQNCKSVHHESNTCFIFNQATVLDDKDGAVYSMKQCSNTPLFGCDRCEDDLVNSCKPDSCSEYGMCQDLLEDNSKCLCPITGSYTGSKCERVSDLCNPDPCGGNGECYDYSVRYQCVCKAGWTGTNCETNINECVENPNGCLYNGTCMDQVNKYTCSCSQGFSGDRCKDISDFCSPNPCQEGICYENYDTFNFMCKCEDPYRNDAGGSCEMIPACDNVNCTNGTCSSGKCICETGFEGSLCQHNIDDCMNMPCQHAGTCTDMINSYDCQCVTGYDGDNCEINIDDCVGMCTGSNVDPNTNGCRDMLDDYRCNCKAGYTGKNCTEEINECLLYPCEHGGTCTDKVADFECSCREGWTGKRCETPIEYCAPSPCLNGGVCFNLTDDFFCRCPGGTTGVTCGNSPEVCSIIDPCTMKGTCQDKDGTAQCNCNDDYAGTSCQLIKDHCADPDMCNNEGQCVTNLIGFKCECDDSYSGSTCSLYTDPCSSNPCHSTAKCISNEDKYMCYCEQGNTLTDSGCKDITTVEENFDIFMDRYIDGMPAYLRNPIVSHTNDSMTIMFWIRVLARPEENPVLLSLEGIQIGSKPTFNPEMQQFIATSQYLILRNSTDMEMVQYDTDVADGKWHFMVFSWEPSGEVKIFIDSIKKRDENVITFDMNEDIIMQMIIGSADTHGRISKVRIYKTVFSDIEIYKAKDTDLPSDELVQGWTNIVLSRSTFRMYPSGAGNEKKCDLGFPDCLDEDRTKPSISCPDDQTKFGTERLTAFTGLKNDYTKIEDVKYVNTSVHEDELYIYGSSNEVFVAYDEAMNYDICRFKVYVKYADECQKPETDAAVVYCSPNSKHICGLNCQSGKALSLKHKLKYRCGALGVYNFEHPRKKFILPTCGGQTNQKIALTIDIAYKIVLSCTDALKNTIQSELDDRLKQDLGNKWPGLVCNNCVWDAVCRDSSALHIDVTITLPGLDQTISRGGIPYTVKDAILIFILQEDGLNFNSVGGAELEGDSVTVDVNPSCSSGYTVVGDTCVECGKGTYRNDTTMSCEFCPIGSYQPNVGQTDCTSCQTTKTTLTYGSDSSADCIDDCEPGQYYDIGNSICAQCERHYYQDMSGQEFCFSCPLGMKTSQKGSNSSESCYKDCDAGTELQSDGSCKVCERGFYRTQEDDECKSCVEGFTTVGEKSASLSDCKIKICYAGNFRNATTNECEECPVGWYQSENLQDRCDACPTSHTTDAVGKTHRDNCTFYCDPGMEVVSAESKTCRNCPRGSYRSNNELEILLPCQNCTGGNTTELDGRTTIDQCSIRKCEAGQILDNTGACEDCGMDTYQPDELPKSDTTCLPCNANTNSPQKGTMDVKSTSVDKCILVCKEGQQNDGTSCSACPQGTWSNGNMTMRFGMCYNCSEDWTTEGMGSTHPDNCTLRDCDPGHYISGDNCEPCGFAQYQPNRHADMCLNCSVNQNTSKIASTSQSACQIYCPKGQEGNVSCADCQTNYIKQTEGIAACIACEGNSTSNDAHDACSEMFCDKGLYKDMGICVPCEVGKYKDERGNDNTCTPCNAGNTTAGPGSDSEQDCNVLHCEPGKFENTTSNRCEVCPVKTYKSVVGNTDCIDCIASKTTPDTGTTSADGCSLEYCSPGYKRTTPTNCEKCAVGKYQPMYGMTTCLSCDPGYTTASTGTVNQTDCYQICPIGFQFDSNKKECVGCLLGYYKDEVGNAEDCKKCPVNKTTEFANSTAKSFCSVDDCPAGYRRQSPGCVVCEKGTYQSEWSQMTCVSCPNDYTTEKEGATKQEECIVNCTDGKEYDFATKACTNCLKGFITNRPTTEKCIKCPSGQTTAYGGSNDCYKNTVTTSTPPLPSTIEMVFVFQAKFDCNDAATLKNYMELVRTTIIKRLETLATTYPLLCTSGCTNVKLLVISITACDIDPNPPGRRKREAVENLLSFNVQVPDVPATVASTGTNDVRPAESVIEEDLTINKDRYAPLNDKGTPILTPLTARVNRTIKICPTGQTQIDSNCVPCPKGTKSSSSQCIDCEVNTYQDETGQTTCKACSGSVMKYTLATGSNSSSQCISICDKTPGYCNNFGTCHADQHSQYCTCRDNYEGSRCSSKAEKTSSNTAIIGGAVGGGVGLLVIILIVVIVCSRFYGVKSGADDLERKKFNRTYDMESDAPYRNPMYDNRAYPRQMLAAYPYNWGSDPYDHDPYAPYMAQKQIRAFESDEDYYQPRGTPKESPRRQTHEWHAAAQT